MAYTAATATTEVRNLLNEVTASFWTDAQIQGWIKQGCLDTSSKVMAYVTEQTITLATGTFKYTLTEEAWIANLVRIKHAWYKDAANAKGLARMEFEQLGNQQTNTAGPPKWFLEERQLVWVWPVPTASENGDTVYCLAATATDDITNIRYEYQPSVIYFATAMAKLRDRKYQEASLYQQLYLNSIGFERQDKFDLKKDLITKFRSS